MDVRRDRGGNRRFRERRLRSFEIHLRTRRQLLGREPLRFGFLGRAVANQNLLVWGGLLSVLVVWIVVFRTALGLRLRSVGENPRAAESQAISQEVSQRVERIRSLPRMVEWQLAEFGRVLGDKFSWENHMVEAAVAQVARIGTVVRPKMSVSVIGDDPADDRVLEAAKEGTADVIVSGDRHLLRLGTWETVRIVRVRDLLEELEG